jgi:hypothetical protein
MKPRCHLLLAVGAFLLIAIIARPAAAQGQAPPQAQPPQSPQGQAPQGQRPQGQAPAPGAGSDSLSGQLSRSGGVIHPPAEVDKPMEAPTPDPGARSTPVIPPPGAPGGNPDIKPK